MTRRQSGLAWVISIAVACAACAGGDGGTGGQGVDAPSGDAPWVDSSTELRGDAAPDTIATDFSAPGPYQVGITELDLYDEVREREVRTMVWYPALPDGQERITYLLFVEGGAYVDAPPDLSAAPYPRTWTQPGPHATRGHPIYQRLPSGWTHASPARFSGRRI